MTSKLYSIDLSARMSYATSRFNIAALVVFLMASVFTVAACSSQPAPPPQQPEVSPFGNSNTGSFQIGDNGAIPQPDAEINGGESGIGRNISEINIDVSSVTPRDQRYLFVIDRGQNQVRIADASAADALGGSDDILATLTIEVVDPDKFTASSGPGVAATIVGFTIDYDISKLRILTDNGLEIASTAEGSQTASAQTEASGVRATLTVEAIESQGPDDFESPDNSAGANTYASRDRHETLIDLSGQPDGGSVKINIRIQETEPPVAALSPLDEGENGQDTREDPPQPEAADNNQDAEQNNQNDNPQPDTGAQDPSTSEMDKDANDGQGPASQDNSPGSSGEPPPKDEGPGPEQETPPNDDPQDTIVNTGSGSGEPFADNWDVMLLIDSSTSVLPRDRNNYRGLAARAYLSAAKPDDQVGFVHFIEYVVSTRLTAIEKETRVNPNGKKQRVIDVLNENVTLPGTGFTNIDRALTSACKELEKGRSPNRAAILITDGAGNLYQPLGSEQACFSDSGWPMFILGIAEPEQDVLGKIATNTDGNVVTIDGPEALVCEIQRVRSVLAGGTQEPCKRRRVIPARDNSFIQTVAPGQTQATFSITWTETSSMITQLISPSGLRVIGNVFIPSGVDVIHDRDREGNLFEIYSVVNPEPGEWKLEIISPGVLLFEVQDVIFGFSTLPASR